jgi:SAM-dependent methyltransferase
MTGGAFDEAAIDREPLSVGDDHCRVTEPTAADDLTTQLEYYRHLFPYAHAASHLPRSAHVLEVGCGAGYGASYLARSVAVVSATDTSAQAVAYASASYPNVHYQVAEGTQLPFASDSFDAVVSFQVIEHIPDALRYLHELNRVLRPGGTAFITTPNRRLRLLPLQPPWNPYHVVEYSDRALVRLCRRAFAEASVLGVIAKPSLMAMERARVARQRKLALLGPPYQLALQWLPARLLEPLKARIAPSPSQGASMAASTASTQAADRECGAGETKPEPAVSLADFFLAEDTRTCLDLFVTARKR